MLRSCRVALPSRIVRADTIKEVGMKQAEEVISFAELCEVLGKPRVYVSRLQHGLKLPVPDPSQSGYGRAYICFLEKIVALRTLNVPLSDLANLLQKEIRLLELMRFDALSESPTWFLDECGRHSGRTREDCLVLCGYCIGFPLDSPAIQTNLDFGSRETNLFSGQEMGEDVGRSLVLYRERARRLQARVEKEIPILQNALYWGARLF